MSLITGLALFMSSGLVVYLTTALLFPERFE